MDWKVVYLRKGDKTLDYIEVDGIIRGRTIKLINEIPESILIKNLTTARLSYIRGLKNYNHNKNGWESRIRSVAKL